MPDDRRTPSRPVPPVLDAHRVTPTPRVSPHATPAGPVPPAFAAQAAMAQQMQMLQAQMQWARWPPVFRVLKAWKVMHAPGIFG